MLTNWRPWQYTVFDLLKEQNSYIEYIYYKGSIGKNVITKYLSYYGFAHQIPTINSYSMTMKYVMEMPKIGTYVINISKSKADKSMDRLYTALEEVKIGYAESSEFNFEFFDSPNIIVFSTKPPDDSINNAKRQWRIWTIEKDQLIPA